MFVLAAAVGLGLTGELGLAMGVIALAAAITGAVLGQIGRGMQGRVI